MVLAGRRPADAMFVLGLTGSIAMGKSTAAADLPRARRAGVRCRSPRCTACWRRAAPRSRPVAAAFPACARGRRRSTARRSAGWRSPTPAALARLEAILHPLVRGAERRFLARCAAARRPLVVLDIPLLFETGGERLVDAVAVVSAPAFRAGAARARPPGHDAPTRLAAIRARQLPDAEKRRRADFVIPTGLERRRAVAAIAALVDRAARPPARPGRAAGCAPALGLAAPPGGYQASARRRPGGPMREIVLDTETTGLEPGEGHRVVEIGALELVNHVPTGRVFHSYLNPERDMPADAQLVHGLTAAFLASSRCSPRWSTTSSRSSTTTGTRARRRPGS